MSNLPGVWGTWGGYLPFFVAGFLASEPWRWAGALIGRDLDPNSEVFIWVRAVSSAIVAGLVARLVVFPTGAMAAMSAPTRYGAAAVGIAAFFAFRKNLGAGVLAGTLALLAGHFIIG
ncbi:AzlD domain-containing protein [Hyphomicrobium sp. CS1BSMeth3]|uniref:AzlD domain-containing protein n=1 Tax=Hyphomicrobium sp. CS1BSMeth3 TaxID=1892844 RepID=UPI00093020B7|nr:AzlD domain-containing protein [Hyphomicrobium sp. CS1BSMeth3]